MKKGITNSFVHQLLLVSRRTSGPRQAARAADTVEACGVWGHAGGRGAGGDDA